MVVQRIPIFAWPIIALIVGAVLGYLWTSSMDDGGTGTMTPQQFFRHLPRARMDDGSLACRGIVIYPAQRGSGAEQVQRIEFKEMRRNKESGKWQATPQSVIAPVPFLRGVADVPKDNRVADWLGSLKQQDEFKDLDYHYAWWHASTDPELSQADPELYWWQRYGNAWMVAIGGSVLLIGVVWPVMIRFMVRLGLGVEEEEGVDLSKVRSSSPAAVADSSRVTDEDLDQLGALNAQLEANVAGMLINDDDPDEAEERRLEEAAIRKLENQRLQPQSANTKPDEPREYQGEYYPVAKPGGKKA